MAGLPTWTYLNQTLCQSPGSTPRTPSLLLSGRWWSLDGGAFTTTPYLILWSEVSCQNCLLGYKNVALIVPRVGVRAFVEDHNSAIQVTVNIM